MHRLLYICDWLPPDFGAVGQYSLIFARQRAEAGEDVVLVGLSSTADSITEEVVNGGRFRVVRRWSRPYDRADLVARALWTARTNLALGWSARAFLLDADEIVITGSPPFLLHVFAPLAALLDTRLTYRITDFHPECLMAEIAERGSTAKGAGGREAREVPWSLRAFYGLTLSLRNRVDQFEVLGEDQRGRLTEQGIAADRIVLKRDPSPVQFSARTGTLEPPPELEGRTLLLYSGNLGVAHDYATFARAYTHHHRKGSGRVGLWLNATGARADQFESELRSSGLPVHRSRPVPLSLLPSLLRTAQAHLITLRDAFVGYVLPSKVYACIESGRDLVYIGSRRSDIHQLCATTRKQGYFQADVGDAAGVAAALEQVADRSRTAQDRPYGTIAT